MVYASAYTYRASVWFDFVLPGPEDRKWLKAKYPRSWQNFEPIWDSITERWTNKDPHNECGVHGTAIVGFCNLCQIILANGTTAQNSARIFVYNGKTHIFCSEPCQWIFEKDPERYAGHNDLVKRVLIGEAPGNLISMVRNYFGLSYGDWGKDIFGGQYPFIDRSHKIEPRSPKPTEIKRTKIEKSAMLPVYGFLDGDTLGLPAYSRRKS